MNLRQLEVFVAVADSRSFSKGGEIASVTQSTVSQNIQALEEEFGIRLFDRTGKGALLTAGGRVLLDKARRLLGYAREIPAAIDRFKGIAETALRIAGSSIPGEYLIPPVLPGLVRRYPGIGITLRQGDSQQVYDWILAEQADIGVAGGHYTGGKLECRRICNDEIVLVAPRGHHLADGRVIKAVELLKEPFVVREDGSGTGQSSVMALGAAGIAVDRLRKTAILGSNHAVTRAVTAGLGVSFVSALSVRDELSQGSLVRVNIKDIVINRQFYLVTRKNRKLSPAAEAFCEVMFDLYGDD